jgi:hypothetical protein
MLATSLSFQVCSSGSCGRVCAFAGGGFCLQALKEGSGRILKEIPLEISDHANGI